MSDLAHKVRLGVKRAGDASSFAARVGVSRSTVFNLLAGQTPSVKTLQKLVDARVLPRKTPISAAS